MPIKGQHTKSDYMEWDTMLNLVLKLKRDKNYVFSLLLGVGCRIGLRISDLLTLRWIDLSDKDVLVFIEHKTGKTREITIHPDLKTFLNEMMELMNPDMEDYLFANSIGQPYSIQHINRRLKQLCKLYKIKGRYSSHSFRKTLARRAFEVSGESEKTLILLSDLLNHSSIEITRRYLGIRKQEISAIYLSL